MAWRSIIGDKPTRDPQPEKGEGTDKVMAHVHALVAHSQADADRRGEREREPERERQRDPER